MRPCARCSAYSLLQVWAARGTELWRQSPRADSRLRWQRECTCVALALLQACAGDPRSGIRCSLLGRDLARDLLGLSCRAVASGLASLYALERWEQQQLAGAGARPSTAADCWGWGAGPATAAGRRWSSRWAGGW